MKIEVTKRSSYTLRLLVHLAGVDPGTLVASGRLGEACGVPPGNVPTLVHVLSRAGLVSCSPGRNGGCRLAHDPAQVTLRQVVEAVEGPLAISECVLKTGPCSALDEECPAHATLSRAREALASELETTTLSDLVRT